MKRILALFVVLILCMSPVMADIQGTYVDGSGELDNGTMTVTSQGEGFHIRFPSDANLRYSENESWNETYTVVERDEHRTYLEGAETGDTGDWYDSNISATVVRGSPEVRVVDPDNRTIEITGGDGAINLNPEETNGVVAGENVTEVEISDMDFEDEQTDLRWEVSDTSRITINEISGSGSMIVVDSVTGRVIAQQQIQSGGIDFEVDENRSVYVQYGSNRTVGNFTVSPIYERIETQASGFELVTYQVTNTGNETREINVTSQNDWIENTNSQTVLADTSTEMTVRINSSAIPEGTERGYLIWEVGNETGATTIEVELDVLGGYTEQEFFGLPTWTLMLTTFTVIFVIGPVLWLMIEPRDSPNTWL